MRAKSLLLLMLALGCGLVASIGITQVMGKKSANVPIATGEMLPIFVALEDIPRGDRISAQALKLEEWPKDKVPEGALTKIEDVEGRLPKTKIFQGEPILDNKLLSKGATEGLASQEIPVGYRVVSVNVTRESGVSDLVRPGDRVDVLLYMRQTPGTIVETATRTILQDIMVFAVNDVFDLEKTEGDQSINAKTVSLLVTPSQAETFTLATELGTIRLALRSHEDKEQAKVQGAFPHELGRAEQSNREKEELARAPNGGDSDDLDGFLDLLNKHGSQSPSGSVVAAAPDSWAIRLIKADQIEEVVMEMTDHAATPDAKPSGFNSWKTVSTPRSTGPDLAAVDDAPGQPAGDEAGEKEGGEHKGGKDGGEQEGQKEGKKGEGGLDHD